MGQVPYELIGTGSWNNVGTNVGTNQISNLLIFVLKKGHRGNITVHLDRIHQYLCPVKFI